MVRSETEQEDSRHAGMTLTLELFRNHFLNVSRIDVCLVLLRLGIIQGDRSQDVTDGMQISLKTAWNEVIPILLTRYIVVTQNWWPVITGNSYLQRKERLSETYVYQEKFRDPLKIIDPWHARSLQNGENRYLQNDKHTEDSVRSICYEGLGDLKGMKCWCCQTKK